MGTEIGHDLGRAQTAVGHGAMGMQIALIARGVFRQGDTVGKGHRLSILSLRRSMRRHPEPWDACATG